MILFATASLAECDVQTCRDVRAYVSMGFLSESDPSRDPEQQAVVQTRRDSVKAYCAMGLNTVEQVERRVHIETGYPHILVSFAYDEDATFFRDKMGYSPPDRLGDSGAFTAWTTGKHVDLSRLIAWCRANVEQHPEFQCISLDVIPGSPGRTTMPTRKERELAMAESLENGDAMRAAGLRIMEVFHVGEPIDHLDVIMERRQPGEVIGLGGLVGRSSTVKRGFCDAAFRRVLDYSGSVSSLVPVHGLGLSIRSPLASRYPWWSIDSSSWIAPAKFGQAVGRSGKTGRDDDRTKNRSVRHLYLTRVLEGWLRTERSLTEMWERRGVAFQP